MYLAEADSAEQIPKALFRANRIEHGIDREIGHPHRVIAIRNLKPCVRLLVFIQRRVDLGDAVW